MQECQTRMLGLKANVMVKGLLLPATTLRIISLTSAGDFKRVLLLQTLVFMEVPMGNGRMISGACEWISVMVQYSVTRKYFVNRSTGGRLMNSGCL